MSQFFVSSIINNTATISGEDYYHLVTVKRAKLGEYITIVDSDGNRYSAVIVGIDEKEVKVTVVEELRYPSPKLLLTLCVGLLKGKKFDLVIQKATEIGVHSIIPMKTERSIPDIEEKEEKKLARWQKIAYEAAKQCLRANVPKIEHIMTFADVMQLTTPVGILAHADPSAKTLRDFLKETAPSTHVMLAVGPEGGFSKKEVEIARTFHWNVLYNGSTQLRAETAAIVLPAIIMYEWGYI